MEELLDTVLLPFALLVVFQLLGLGYSLDTLFKVVDIWLASGGVLTFGTQFIEWITTFFVFVVIFVFIILVLVLVLISFSAFFLGLFFGSLLGISRFFTSLFFLTLGGLFDLVVFFRLLLLGSRYGSQYKSHKKKTVTYLLSVRNWKS